MSSKIYLKRLENLEKAAADKAAMGDYSDPSYGLTLEELRHANANLQFALGNRLIQDARDGRLSETETAAKWVRRADEETIKERENFIALGVRPFVAILADYWPMILHSEQARADLLTAAGVTDERLEELINYRG